MKNEKIISVIIVNWNGKKWLKKCLDSLLRQTYKKNEIVLVDNNSNDGSISFVEKNYKSVIIVKNNENRGFAGGNNDGYKKSNGEFVLLLNNDTWVEDDYLEKMIEGFKLKPDIACIQSKILLMNDPDRLDVCGSYWTDSGFLYHYGYGKNEELKKYNTAKPFFSNKGASMIIKREIIEKIGLFDEDFWCYYEETDFCNRVWISGYECWYYPKAIAHHAGGGTAGVFENSFIQFHNYKNKLASFLINYEIKTLIRFLPVYLFLNMLIFTIWFFSFRFKLCLALLRAFLWNISHFKKTIEKRKKIQKIRVKSDKEIFNLVKKNPNLIFYFYLFFGLEKYEDKEII